MSDKDFDRIFSKGLDGTQRHHYDSADWEKLAERLNEHDKNIVAPIHQDPTSTPLWKKYSWLALLLLLLLASNAAIFLKMNQAESKNNTLLNEVNNLRNTIEKANNTTNEKVIIQKDTIIIYKYLPSTSDLYEKARPFPTNQNRANTIINTTPSVSNSLKSQNNINILKDTNSTLFTSASTLHNQQSLKNTIFNQKDTSTKAVHSLDDLVDKNSVASRHNDILLPLKNNDIALVNSLNTPKILNNLGDFSKIVKPTQPNKKFYVGLSGGLINYHTSWISKDNVEIYHNEKSYQTGIRLEYAMNDNWRIIGGSDYCPFSFKIYWQDPRYNLPSQPKYFIDNPSEYKLKSTAASQQLLQGFLGIKYLFGNSRWKPYVGLSYTTMRILPFETTYLYTRLSNNQEITRTVNQNQISVSNLGLISGGFEYRLNRRFITQAEAFYYKDLNKTKKTYDLFGTRLSVLFGF